MLSDSSGQSWNHIRVLKYPKQIVASMTVGEVVFLVMEVTDATRGRTKQPSSSFLFSVFMKWWTTLELAYPDFSLPWVLFCAHNFIFLFLFKSNFNFYQTKTAVLSIVVSVALGQESLWWFHKTLLYFILHTEIRALQKCKTILR